MDKTPFFLPSHSRGQYSPLSCSLFLPSLSPVLCSLFLVASRNRGEARGEGRGEGRGGQDSPEKREGQGERGSRKKHPKKPPKKTNTRNAARAEKTPISLYRTRLLRLPEFKKNHPCSATPYAPVRTSQN